MRKWLQLRLNAWLRGRVFELTQVNTSFLRRIDVAVRPITRELPTHGTGELSDASVDRVFNDASCAAGNLALMSARPNGAKSHYGVDDAMTFVRQIEAGKLGHIDGLTAEQWARIAVLTPIGTAGQFTEGLAFAAGAKIDVYARAATCWSASSNQRVAGHVVSTVRGGFTTTPEHTPASHRAHLNWTPAKLIA